MVMNIRRIFCAYAHFLSVIIYNQAQFSTNNEQGGKQDLKQPTATIDISEIPLSYFHSSSRNQFIFTVLFDIKAAGVVPFGGPKSPYIHHPY